MMNISDLSKIAWNNRVDDFYSDRANIFRYCSLAAIFAFAKWIIGVNMDMALLLAFAGSTLVFGLFLNRVRNIAASGLLMVFALVYYFILGPVLEKITGLFLFNPGSHSGFLAFVAWLAIVSGLLGVSFLIGCSFFNRQMPRNIHRIALCWLLVLGHVVTYSWLIIALSCYFVSLKPICLVVVIAAFIIALFVSRKPAQNISWDLFVARSANLLRLDEDAKTILEALPGALKSSKNVALHTDLAMKYAQCTGIMRNPQQCIRWAESSLAFLDGGTIDAAALHPDDREIGRRLAHMLLYVVYERSEEYKSPAEAEKHKKAFDQTKTDISKYLYYWSDPKHPFEDHEDSRYFGIPYEELKKIAESEPDAYCTLFEYCSKFSLRYENTEAGDLAAEYLKKGMDLNSPACQRELHMLNLARDLQNSDFLDGAETTEEKESPSSAGERPQYSLNPNYPNITISGS